MRKRFVAMFGEESLAGQISNFVLHLWSCVGRHPRVAKVILIGEAVHYGRKLEAKALIYSVFYKAFLFGWLVLAFHILEEMIERVVHGKDIAGAFHEIRLGSL